MTTPKKWILIVFFLIMLFDFYDCTQPGHQISKWLRPLQLQIIFVFVLQKKLSLINNLLLFISLAISSITEYLFYSTGLLNENSIIFLLIIKKMCFLILLYQGITKKVLMSNKLLRWLLIYFFIAMFVCFLVVANENLFYYLLAFQSGLILMFISLQVKDLQLFKQMYLGYAMIILAMIFGKILIKDPRWFVEILTRFMLLIGHLLFLSALAKIKLIPINSKPFDNQTVDKS